MQPSLSARPVHRTSMVHQEHNDTQSTGLGLPPPRRLFGFAVLLPAAMAISNQLLLNLASGPWLRNWLYPWMAFTVAVLSWCVGRYLSPAWLRWLVFVWCLALLDALTIPACLSGPIEEHFAYVMVSAQISLITLWAVLSRVGWQWRLPGLLIGVPALISFARIISPVAPSYNNWNVLMLLAAVSVLLLCGMLRLSRFLLQRPRLAQRLRVRIRGFAPPSLE